MRTPSTAIAVATALWASSAAAHISLDQASTHMSRYGDNEIKDGPCGRAGGTRGEHVYTYAPGETITVEISEFIPHPGYFRIAFDDDGDDDFVDPVSIKPLDPARPCPFDEFDQCGTTDDYQDFYNNETVLMDNLDPHLTAELGTLYSWEVTLPNIECDNCTLQIIQVMEDVIHGGYNTDRSIEPNYIEDVYHQCIDLVLEGPVAPGEPDAGLQVSGPTDAGGSAPAAEGDGGQASPGPGAGGGGSSDDSGCSCSIGKRTSSGGAGAAALIALGAALGLRRRRSVRT